MLDDCDYDNAAKELFIKLNIDPDSPCEDDCISLVYQNKTGGKLFLGDQRAAKSIEVLEQLNIKAVVNCTHNMENVFPELFTYEVCFN